VTEGGTINPGPASPVQSAAMTRHCPQAQPFKELPSHLAQMAFYKVNTDCRDAEICNLRVAALPLRSQPIDATHSLNLSAGEKKADVRRRPVNRQTFLE